MNQSRLDLEFKVIALIVIGFCVFMIGLAGCEPGNNTPEHFKKEETFKSKCLADCTPRAMDEFASGFSGECRCKP